MALSGFACGISDPLSLLGRSSDTYCTLVVIDTVSLLSILIG